MSEALLLDRLPTPIGEALLVVDAAGRLRLFDWAERESDLPRLLRRHCGGAPMGPSTAPVAMRDAVQRYFAGETGALAGLPWHTAGTPFQQRVWTALTTIPPGRTLSYGALAKQLGCPGGMRAVGLANGSNPISIVVPCHRVIGADGTLTGYGGGLPRKRWLLRHEGAAFRDARDLLEAA